jgi:hypothetical protein
VAESAVDRVGDLVRFLAGEPWIGTLFLRDDLLSKGTNALPQSAVFGMHARSAAIKFSYRWWPKENEYGVHGCSASYSSIAASHGSASPYEINNTLIAWGKGIKQGTRSSIPCGIVDVAPTVLHLLDISPPASMQGRVLEELLIDGPLCAELPIAQVYREAVLPTDGGLKHHLAQYSVLDGHTYFDWAKLTP